MLQRLAVSHELLEKYEKAAEDTFDYNFVNKDLVMKNASEAELCDENIKLLSDFMDYADDDIKRFIWLFYYIQFKTDEYFVDDIWRINQIPMPQNAEKHFPGCIKSVTYLLSAENLKEWIAERSLSSEILDGYYDRYRAMVNYNIISYDTYALCRLSPFLYGYSKPFMFCLGRLTFQYSPFKNYSELYENSLGERLFVALPNYTYNNKGLQDVSACFTPEYKKCGDKLYAHIFKKDGTMSMKADEIDINEYKSLYKPGDMMFAIHIPERGGKLTKELVRETLEYAENFLRKYFPDYKTFVCQTWFIDPHLRGEVIKEESNLAAFADIFDVICGPDNENHSVFEHVFKTSRKPLDELVAENSFQERVLKRAKRGEKIYWSFGVLKKDYKLNWEV